MTSVGQKNSLHKKPEVDWIPKKWPGARTTIGDLTLFQLVNGMSNPAYPFNQSTIVRHADRKHHKKFWNVLDFWVIYRCSHKKVVCHVSALHYLVSELQTTDNCIHLGLNSCTSVTHSLPHHGCVLLRLPVFNSCPKKNMTNCKIYSWVLMIKS